MIELVISGGQTGVDQAGLRAARACGIPTGGWAPKGWRTEDGNQRELLKSFGLQEHQSFGYPPRTRANVDLADATVIIVGAEMGTGSRLTSRICGNLSKPCRILHAIADAHPIIQQERQALDLVEWLRDPKFKVINIAGSRESGIPGIGDWAKMLLLYAFRKVNKGEEHD